MQGHQRTQGGMRRSTLSNWSHKTGTCKSEAARRTNWKCCPAETLAFHIYNASANKQRDMSAIHLLSDSPTMWFIPKRLQDDRKLLICQERATWHVAFQPLTPHMVLLFRAQPQFCLESGVTSLKSDLPQGRTDSKQENYINQLQHPQPRHRGLYLQPKSLGHP